MNEFLILIEAVLAFAGLVAMGKTFGKTGIVAWMSMALILANITTAKNIDLFGLETTLGTVMFATTFLATDMLTEKYGKFAAIKGILLSWVVACAFLAFTTLATTYEPNSLDFISNSMDDVFSYNVRITSASLVMCLVANLLDIWIYSKLKAKMGGRHMWVRNNVATITCNCGENFLFMLLAFGGVFPISDILMIALTTSIIEAALAVFDTPFLYMYKLVGKGKAPLE